MAKIAITDLQENENFLKALNDEECQIYGGSELDLEIFFRGPFGGEFSLVLSLFPPDLLGLSE